MLEDQRFKCALSGITLHPETVEVDHILTVQDGGDDSPENLHLLDARVHGMRGTLEIKEFIDLCCRVADWSRRYEA